MNVPAIQPKTISAPNGNDEPPPHPGFDAPAAPAMRPAAQVFDTTRRSQGTMVEQARAIAEVQAAVHVAQERPRNTEAALERMRVVCRIMGLAERAFFAFPRGGQTVSGESVHLARELARCWGNIDYGVKELARSDARAESEMLAFAWDLETNTRNETTFIVPHMRDKRGGPQRLTDMRDIYENNANQAARRVRECVFAVLPKWFTDEAVEICRATLQSGGGKTLGERKSALLTAFEAAGITLAMIEKREGKSMKGMAEIEVANLSILYRSLRNNEITRDEAFPETSAEDVTTSLKDKVANQPIKTTDTPPPVPAVPAASTPTTANPHAALAKTLIDKIGAIGGSRMLEAWVMDSAEDIEYLRTEALDQHKTVQAAIDAKRAAFKK